MDDDESAKTIAAAREIGLELPLPCLPGVIENRRVLDQHRDTISAFLDAHPQS